MQGILLEHTAIVPTRYFPFCCCLCCCLLFPWAVLGQDLPGPKAWPPATLDPMLQVVARWHEQPQGPLARDFARSGAPLGLQLKVRDEVERARRDLRAYGIELGVCVARVCAARLKWSALPGLLGEAVALGEAGAERIEVAWSPLVLRPEDGGERSDAGFIHHHPVSPFRGAGVLVADIDSGIDPLHPALFHADGGRFAWVDVDGDGALTPGKDGVDLNQNGKIDFNETLRVLDATRVEDFDAGQLTNTDARFQANKDWLYLDFNRNGERDAGSDAGFFERDAGYGEPLFVLDDFDKDTQASPWEGLVMLGTSKIVTFVYRGKEYERGKNLIEAAKVVRQTEGAFHGTAVAGVLLGGQEDHHDLVGVAPQAELMVFGYLGDQGQVADELRQTAWQVAHLSRIASSRAQLVLHEWTDPFLQPLDGSTLLEEAMAAMSGRVHIAPLGNLNLSGKHAQEVASPGARATLAFVAPKTLRSQRIEALVGSLQWRGGDQGVALFLRDPIGGRHVISTRGDTSLRVAGTQVDVAFEATRAGNTFGRVFFQATRPGESVTQGAWVFEVESRQQTLQVVGRLSDLYSGWRQGVGWEKPSKDAMTLSYPATAPAALGVAAASRTVPGQAQAYSGRGPTLDGRPGVWVAAPDDGLAPVAQTRSFLEAGWGAGWYARFGGTSAAAPYVTGALALMLSEDPELGPEELRERLVFGVSGGPHDVQRPDTGWGEADLWRLFYGEDLRPRKGGLKVVATGREEGESWVLDATASTGWTAMRFDADGDGLFESGWRPVASWTVSKQSLLRPPQASRVQGRNDAGELGGVRVSWSVDTQEPAEALAKQTLQGGCASAGGAGKKGGGANFLWCVVSLGICLGRRRRG